eukprot:RCo003991
MRAALARVPSSAVPALAFLGGALSFYAVAVRKGYVPLWAGPEKEDWAKLAWSSQDCTSLSSIADLGGTLFQPLHTTRSFTQQTRRGFKYQLYWIEQKRTLLGLAQFNADTEGLPRRVHQGASQTIADLAMTGAAQAAMNSLVATILQVQTSYLRGIPLGGTVLVESVVEAPTAAQGGDRVTVRCTLSEPQSRQPYILSTAVVAGLRAATIAAPSPAAVSVSSRPWWKFW